MPTLLEVQNAFRRDLFTLDGEAAATAASFVEPDGVAPASRLQIHRNHTFTTLSEALAGIYPAVQAMVGTSGSSTLKWTS